MFTEQEKETLLNTLKLIATKEIQDRQDDLLSQTVDKLYCLCSRFDPTKAREILVEAVGLPDPR